MPVRPSCRRTCNRGHEGPHQPSQGALPHRQGSPQPHAGTRSTSRFCFSNSPRDRSHSLIISAEARGRRMRRFFGSRGSISRVTIESQALKNNMLDDSFVRAVDVYVPAGHDGQGLPLLVDLAGFTSSSLSHTNWVGFRENVPERLDRLIRARGRFMQFYTLTGCRHC